MIDFYHVDIMCIEKDTYYTESFYALISCRSVVLSLSIGEPVSS
jgi:hypothetical protein